MVERLDIQITIGDVESFFNAEKKRNKVGRKKSIARAQCFYDSTVYD